MMKIYNNNNGIIQL